MAGIFRGKLMACFLVPLAEAVVISTAKFAYSKRIARETVQDSEKQLKLESFTKKVNVLQNMLYGGSFLLAVDHVFTGELSWQFPFLTALKTPADTQVMLHEIGTVGVAMAVSITALWGIWAAFKSLRENRTLKNASIA